MSAARALAAATSLLSGSCADALSSTNAAHGWQHVHARTSRHSCSGMGYMQSPQGGTMSAASALSHAAWGACAAAWNHADFMAAHRLCCSKIIAISHLATESALLPAQPRHQNPDRDATARALTCSHGQDEGLSCHAPQRHGVEPVPLSEQQAIHVTTVQRLLCWLRKGTRSAMPGPTTGRTPEALKQMNQYHRVGDRGYMPVRTPWP